MYNISDELKTAMQSEVIITTARITVLDDNTVIDGNNLCTVKITDKCYQDGVIIGTAMCKELEIELINDNFDLADKEFSLEVGVKLPSGEYEYIPYGNYIVKEYTDTKSSNKYTIIAYDYMDKLNSEFTDDYDYAEPITLQTFYENFAKFYDIEIVEQTLPNQDFLIGNKPYFDGMTGREVAARIAEMFGSFAKFNRENKLQMYLQTPTNEKISRNEMNSSLTINNKFGPINTVVLRLSDIEGENVTLKDEESIKTNGEVTLQIQDNPFIYTEDLRKKAIQAIFDRVKGFEYYPTSFNSKLIYFDCGDIVEVQNMNSDEYYPTMILDQTLQIPNTIKSTFANEALTSTAVKNQYTSAQTVKNRRTEYLIDKQNQKITQIIEKTTEVENKSIYSVQVLYALGDSETEAPSEGWSTTAPQWENGKYMWQKTVTIYGDGSTKESDATNISGANGKDGEKGDKGEAGVDGKDGTNGKDGEDGLGISSIVTQYYLSSSSTELLDGEWKETQDEWQDEMFYWTRAKITWTDNSVTYTDPVLAEGINNANSSASTAQKQYAYQSSSLTSLSNKVGEITTTLNNDYYTKDQEDIKFDELMDNINVVSAKQTEFEQTKENFEFRINSIETDGVTKVKTTTGYTFDEEGFKLNRDGAETGTIIDEAAIKVIDKTASTFQDLLYAGYVKEGDTKYSEYIGQTVVVAANMIVKNYLVVPNSRFENYTNPTLKGKGTGVFGI